MNNTSKSGIGLCGILAIVFIILKLVGIVNWPWLWVLSPIWIPTVLAIIAFVLGIIIMKWLGSK